MEKNAHSDFLLRLLFSILAACDLMKGMHLVLCCFCLYCVNCVCYI